MILIYAQNQEDVQAFISINAVPPTKYIYLFHANQLIKEPEFNVVVWLNRWENGFYAPALIQYGQDMIDAGASEFVNLVPLQVYADFREKCAELGLLHG